MGARNGDIFHFRHFSLMHKNSAMKVGTDGVLMGSWGYVGGSRVLDIGSGCGLIALMAAQRNPEAFVTGIEPDSASFDESVINGRNSPFSGRTEFVKSELDEFASRCALKYDAVISNPPFYNDGFLPVSEAKARAKHSSFALSYDSLLDGASALLSDNGIFSVIIPFSSAPDFEEKAFGRGLFMIRKADVIPVPRKSPSRAMCMFSFQRSECLYESIIIEKYGRHRYSEEYVSLTKDFLLHGTA